MYIVLVQTIQIHVPLKEHLTRKRNPKLRAGIKENGQARSGHLLIMVGNLKL